MTLYRVFQEELQALPVIKESPKTYLVQFGHGLERVDKERLYYWTQLYRTREEAIQAHINHLVGIVQAGREADQQLAKFQATYWTQEKGAA